MKSSSSSTSASSLLQYRILCLHDAHSNAQELQGQLTALAERLWHKHKIDLVFVNSPHVVKEASTDEHEESAAVRRVWWYEDDTNNPTESTKCSTKEYFGLDASILFLQQVWNHSQATAPFWGIIGVGQGATMASIFSLLPSTAARNRHPVVVHLAILIDGCAILPETERLTHMPTLHLVAEEPLKEEVRHHDYYEGQQRLVQQFGGRVIPYHRAKVQAECHPSYRGREPYVCSTADLNAIGRFLLEQKRQLFADDIDSEGPNQCLNSGEILALQSALHMAEYHASEAIAQQISENPPNALMAVIRPHGDVAGWSEAKRRQPHEEGGGAPCPSEFLYQRDDKRREQVRSHGSPPGSQDDDGARASRIHPNDKTMGEGLDSTDTGKEE